VSHNSSALISNRLLCCRIISRTTGTECFKSYYKHNTLSLLVACLNHQNIAEGAAETLVSGFVRDINGHMAYFESSPEALNTVMDVMYRASSAVQTHLTNLFAFAIKWPRATEFVRKALSNGLLSLMSYMLKAEALPTQESAIGAITALVQKVQILLSFVPSCAVAVERSASLWSFLCCRVYNYCRTGAPLTLALSCRCPWWLTCPISPRT
jgi:hypothetical protein